MTLDAKQDDLMSSGRLVETYTVDKELISQLSQKDALGYTFIEKLQHHIPVRAHYLPFKRLFDLVTALILMIPAAPLILAFGILIKLETPGKMFYRQERVGVMGKKIYITKLRSMYQDAEKKSGAMWAQQNDARVTKMGAFIRKTRIDELPQLWNVLNGDMSLIGPRPERPNFTQEFSEDIIGFEHRLLVRPGLSGWAQVNGGYDITPEDKLKLDLYYEHNMSLKIDVIIFFKTIGVVFTGDGAR